MKPKKSSDIKLKDLTKAEEQIMQILWKRGEAFVSDFLDDLEEPKPAYNTVSTFVRILVKKGFVGYKAYGKSHQYYPLITKEEYTKSYFRRFITNYFSNSYSELVSFFAREKDISIKDMEDIREIVLREIEKQKKSHE